jgi:hypothetical protein
MSYLTIRLSPELLEQRLIACGYGNNFSPYGVYELFDHLTELAEESGTPQKVSLGAIVRDYEELSLDEVADSYYGVRGLANEEGWGAALQYLEDEGRVIAQLGDTSLPVSETTVLLLRK